MTEVNHSFLADLLDDLDHKQLTSLLNDLAVKGYPCSRANIKGWRKRNGFPINETGID